MGNQQTTRRVSFEREQTGLIAISDSVAKRLRNAGESRDATTVAPAQPDKPAEVNSAKMPSSTKEIVSSESSSPIPPPKIRSQPQERIQPIYYSTQQNTVQQEDYNKAFARLEEQWQERYKRLEGDTERIKQISTEEFNRAVKHVETLFESKNYTVGSADLQKAVMDCYRENTTRSLKCTREADAFIKSIDDYKMGFLSKQVF